MAHNLVVFEVVASDFFVLSSLIMQRLKRAINLLNNNNIDDAIIQGKLVTIYHGKGQLGLAHDFIFINDITKVYILSLDTTEKSKGINNIKHGPAQ